MSIREKVLLYPINGNDYTPERPLVLCDALKGFGSPGPEDGGCFADHPHI
jgi:hypothetical protein